jgi:hypothetical protein
LRDRRHARSEKIARVAIRNVFHLRGMRSMNVTSPINSHATQASSHTLPIKRGGAESSPVDTVTPNTKPAAPGNPAHLGNHVDTTA